VARARRGTLTDTHGERERHRHRHTHTRAQALSHGHERCAHTTASKRKRPPPRCLSLSCRSARLPRRPHSALRHPLCCSLLPGVALVCGSLSICPSSLEVILTARQRRRTVYFVAAGESPPPAGLRAVSFLRSATCTGESCFGPCWRALCAGAASWSSSSSSSSSHSSSSSSSSSS